MKLTSNQLPAALERGLASIYLIASDEPLLVGEATDAVRHAAKEQGFDERSLHVVDRSFRWDALKGDADSLSLFSSRRIVEIRMAAPKPGDAGGKAIRALAEDPDPDRVVILSIFSRLDRNTAKAVWVRTVEKAGVLVEIRTPTRRDLPAFLRGRGQKLGLSLTPDALELLAERVEGNLLAADQELKKLALITEGGRVDADAVLDSVAGSARFDVFRLADAVVAGDLPRAISVLDGLRLEGVAPPLVLWALARELTLLAQLKRGTAGGQNLQQVMASLRVWQSRQPILRQALGRFTGSDLARLMQRAALVDRTIKGLERAPVWESLVGLVLEMLVPERGRLPA